MTPDVPQGGRTMRSGQSPTGMMPDGTKRQVGLDGQARTWPTPYGFMGQEKDGSYGGGGEFAKFVTRTWPTANSRDSSDAARHTTDPGKPMHPGTTLTDAIRTWATPRASPNENRTTKHAPTHGETHGETLAGQTAEWAQAEAWRSPTTTDWKGESARSWQTREDGDTTPRLADQVASLSSGPPAPANASSGSASSQPTPGSPRPRLNPTFVEWMMNFPRGWTDPATWGDSTTSSWPPARSAPRSGSGSSRAQTETPSGGMSPSTTGPARVCPRSDSATGSSESPLTPTSGDSAETPRSDSGKLWPTPNVGDSESGQTKHSFNAQRGGGDSRLRVTALEVSSDLREWTDCAPSGTPSSPPKPAPRSSDCGDASKEDADR